MTESQGWYMLAEIGLGFLLLDIGLSRIRKAIERLNPHEHMALADIAGQAAKLQSQQSAKIDYTRGI